MTSLDAEELLVTHISNHDYADTVQRLEAELARRRIPVFARIDHAANATAVGLDMPPTLVIVFGNPTAGTPVMLAQPEIAIELPLRILVRKAGDDVMVQYRDPAELAESYGLADDVVAPFHVIADIINTAL